MFEDDDDFLDEYMEYRYVTGEDDDDDDDKKEDDPKGGGLLSFLFGGKKG